MNEQFPLPVPSRVALLTSKFTPIISYYRSVVQKTDGIRSRSDQRREAGWVILDLL
jgi:hypothetical protein